MQETPHADVLVLVRDLMFSSKITATARAEQVPVKIVREPARLADLPGRLLIVDLNLEGATEAAAAWRQSAGDRHVVGFVAHVDTAAIEHARTLGIDQVMARSRFVSVLPELLREGGAGDQPTR